MLHRELLILQSLTSMLFRAPIAPSALNATLSRQDPVNVAERMHTNYPAFIGGMNAVGKLSSVLWRCIHLILDNYDTHKDGYHSALAAQASALSTPLQVDECVLAQSRRALVCILNRTATAWRLS